MEIGLILVAEEVEHEEATAEQNPPSRPWYWALRNSRKW